MEKNQVKIVLVIFIILVCGILWFFAGGQNKREDDENVDIFAEQSVSEGEKEAQEQKVYVHITGAVKKPGVYIFDGKPRVIEVVEKAGGFKKDALKYSINQAEMVEDGAQIVIESKKDKKKEAATEGDRDSAGGQQDNAGLLNINTATKEELMTLTGIGESKAMAIISYREENGDFGKIEDIMNITGIKTGVFDKIKNQIKV